MPRIHGGGGGGSPHLSKGIMPMLIQWNFLIRTLSGPAILSFVDHIIMCTHKFVVVS